MNNTNINLPPSPHPSTTIPLNKVKLLMLNWLLGLCN